MRHFDVLSNVELMAIKPLKTHLSHMLYMTSKRPILVQYYVQLEV